MGINKYYLDTRKVFMIVSVCIVVLVYVIQLFRLQLLSPKYKDWAYGNAFLKQVRYPSRGMIYDRKGKLLVYNQFAYELKVVMQEISNLDTIALCKAINISLEECRKRLEDIKDKYKNPGYSPYTLQVFLDQLGNKECSIFQEFTYKFPGFYVQKRAIRKYVYPYASHVLGYISEVDRQNIVNDSYYQVGDYIGKTGVECSYEEHLRGKKGFEILLRNAKGYIEGKYENGVHDIVPTQGENLTLSIDIDLQTYGEELMRNKLGTIIMIEPQTGEILCMISSPTYDPSILVGKQFGKSFASLVQNPYKPLFNRALSGSYPPGSTFKMAQGLAFLQEGIITSNTVYSCHNGWPIGRGRPACHSHDSPLTLASAIGTSCNSYFCWGLKAMIENKKYGSMRNAIDKWRDFMVLQGFGYPLGVDLPGERRGMIPNSQYYDEMYRKNWNVFSVISIAIGQGEVALSPIQICNLATTIANRGYFYIPHVVKKISNAQLDGIYLCPHYTGVESQHYSPIIEGMRLAVTNGTCSLANIPDIAVCGKTGTAQNSGRDHSIFMGFAPMDNPKIAILVFIENGGFGTSCAVPIGRLMIQKYLKDTIPCSDEWIENSIKNMVILRRVVRKK
jgi:penicillin-binding protein 2